MDQKNIEIESIIQQLVLLLDHQQNWAEKHQKSIQKMIKNSRIEADFIPHLSLSELHVIDCIDMHEYPNTTLIATEIGMTKGAVSKIAAKLINRGFIQGSKRENNRKEILYSLTAKGEAVNKIHKKFHDTENKKLKKFLTTFNNKDLILIHKFLKEFLSLQL